MNAEQWREVKSVLQRAMGTPRPHRDAFVDAACRDQPELRREVESLLAAHDDELAKGDPLERLVDTRVRAVMESVSGGAPERSAPHDMPPDAAPDSLREALETGLSAQYDILGALGAGGMGAVYLAHERALGRTVAIKVLRPDRASTPGSRERFRREARIAAGLSHAGIVPLHAFGEKNGLWYFVMEYVRGPSLAERLELEGRLPPDEARRILLAISEALQHAHAHGVIHRDIKPANILLDEEAGRPRLADFGISKVEGSSDSITLTGTVVGTPLYMSPEQATGESEIDARSDIYALGAVAYAMLTGQPPFSGGDAREVLMRRLVQEPAPILESAPRVPPDLAAIVMRCLARERDARWSDATALTHALRGSGSLRGGELPQAVADLPGFAAYALGWLVLWSTLAFSTTRTDSRYLLLLLASLVPVGLSLHVWRLRGYGLGLRPLLRLALRPPQWWGMWWPGRLRHPDDLWPLLPAVARAQRIVLSVFFVVVPIVALVADDSTAALEITRSQAALLLVGVTALVTAAALAWTMRQGLGFDRAMQFLFASTAPSAFWHEPGVARLLAPAGGLVPAPDPAVASDYSRAVDELLERFPAALAPVARAAGQATHHQVARIAALEREIAELARDSGNAEADRLALRLTQISTSEATSPEHRELGDTLRRQLELVWRMQGRRALALARRTSMFALLRALWSQLTLLVEAEHGGAAAVAEGEARVRELSARILEEPAGPAAQPPR